MASSKSFKRNSNGRAAFLLNRVGSTELRRIAIGQRKRDYASAIPYATEHRRVQLGTGVPRLALGTTSRFRIPPLERYLNLNGDSGVTHYDIGATSIRVQFQDSRIYVYDHLRSGKQHVDRMKALAISGRGLGTYISKHVRKAYTDKE